MKAPEMAAAIRVRSRSSKLLVGSVQIRIVLAILVGIAFYIGGTAVRPEPAKAASCEGTNACTGATASIGTESCKGTEACLNASGTIGDNSCIGDYSCRDFNGTLGNNSCHGSEACDKAGDAGGVSIGNDSCDGDFACQFAGQDGGDTDIGSVSCLGGGACQWLGYDGEAVVGDLSCIGPEACYSAGESGSVEIGSGSCTDDSYMCYYFAYLGTGTIGDGSCAGYSACYEGAYQGSAIIGNSSCIGEDACLTAGYDGSASIGDHSCNGLSACFAVGWGGDGTIGNQACNYLEACFGVGASSGPGSVGDGSCNGIRACKFFAYQGPSGSIGNVSCNSEGACIQSSGNIGEGSCNGIENCFGGVQDVGDCENNNGVPPGCNVELTKTANPTSIPETGDTPVTYTVRIEFLEDEDLNWIEDDQFAGLDAATHCRLNGGAAPTVPGTFVVGDVIVCTFTYEPPPGEAGETHDNVFTINVGHPDCPEPLPDSVGPADHECEVTGGMAAILPGEVPGTNDVTAEASVLYLEVVEEEEPQEPRETRTPQRPNIGAALSGLFNGMPTPLPTAPQAVAPAATNIRPPSTGDGGLADEGAVDRGLIIGVVAVFSFTGIAIATRHRI